MRGNSLFVKLPMLIVLAVFLTALAGSLLSIFIGRRILRETALEANANSVRAYASAIGFYMDNARSILETLASLPEMTGPVPIGSLDRTVQGPLPDLKLPQRQVALRVLQHSKVFEYIFFLLPEGSVSLLEPYALQARLSRRDLAFTSWYKRLMRTGQTVISDLHISTATQRPTIIIATLVRNPTGEVVGIWAGALKLEEFSRINIGAFRNGKPQRYGYVTDRRGLIIAHQAEQRYVEDQTDFRAVPPVRAALAGKRDEMQFFDPIERREKLGAYVPLPGPRWAVVYEVPTRVAFAPIDDLTRGIVLASAGLALLLVLIGWGAVRQIVRPLRQLTEAAAAIGSGEFGRAIEVRTGDEIGRLAGEFNRMAAALSDKEAQLRGYAEQLEQTVQERTVALGQLAQANHELEAFSYSISHDLHAPLVTIEGFSRILLRNYAPELPEEARGYLQKVRDSIRQMDRLIDDLLAFSRLSQNPLRKQTVVPTDLVGQALGDLGAERDGRPVEVVLGDLPACEADPTLLKQVFVNLLSNAFKFTRKREGARIEVGCRREGDERIYFVRDNGIGFDMDHAGKLFGVFQRLHRSEEYEGTGVGLAIVQRIIQRHGGRIWAEAAVDQGATFYFTLAGGAASPAYRSPAKGVQ